MADTRCHAIRMSIASAIVWMAAAGLLVSAGCKDASDENNGAPSDPTQPTTPPKPLNNAGDIITVSTRLGFSFSPSDADPSRLDLSEAQPPKVVRGRQVFTSLGTTTRWRVEHLAEPDDVRIVQVDVSLTSDLALKSASSSDADGPQAGPTLHDSLGNYYEPVGYVYRDFTVGKKITLLYEPGRPLRDLKDFPSVSSSKSEVLTLLFKVNRGVTLTSYSYTGQGVRTFSIDVP
ncbi:MAG: hypothetical protein HND57_13425 [Planctomycetes bacterium]|nr:hypothetical protein [Planctomycetota bacterium]